MEYNIQCWDHGFCGVVREGHPLFEQCKARSEAGYIDALCVKDDPVNCSQCAEAKRRRDQEDQNFWTARCLDLNWYGFVDPEEAETIAAFLSEMKIRPGCFLCSKLGSYSCRECPHFEVDERPQENTD